MNAKCHIIQRRIEAAQGRIPADLVIKNCHIVNVYTQTITKGDIAIIDGYIAAVGGSYEGRTIWDGHGAYAAPGLIESHIHIESSYVSLEEFGRLLVPLGTTTAIADPHEIVNVCGLDGLSYMIEAAKQTAMDIRYMVPSCVPATGFDHSGAVLHAPELYAPLHDMATAGLGEFMNYPGVLAGDADCIEKIVAAQDAHKMIDGHSPGLHGQGLQAYIGAGIATDHECASVEDVIERIAAGMYVMLRNGSACHDLPRLIQAVTPATLRRFLLCSDDLHPHTIAAKGHLNEHLRLCVQHGLSPAAAITMATLNPAECYHLTDRGALAPGKRADIVLFEDVQQFKAQAVWIAGQLAGEKGMYIPPFTRTDYNQVRSTIHINDFSMEKLCMHLKSNHVHTIDIIPGSVVTKKGIADIMLDGQGDFVYNPHEDIVKVAVVERHHGTGNVGLGLLRGYGLKRGAVAVSIAHDSHNIITAGTNNADMAAAVRELEQQEGGMVVIQDGCVLASIPLPIAGLMSDQSGDWVDEQMAGLYKIGYQMLGIHEQVDVIMTLCFMSLPVIPAIKFMDTGLFDVESFSFISIEAD